MAHFARINNNNVVMQVIVVGNEDILDENGKESEAVGQAFIASIGLQGTWIQCSYNENFRGFFPGIGDTYDPIKDEFIHSIVG